jgi:hypothetical protein
MAAKFEPVPAGGGIAQRLRHRLQELLVLLVVRHRDEAVASSRRASTSFSTICRPRAERP